MLMDQLSLSISRRLTHQERSSFSYRASKAAMCRISGWSKECKRSIKRRFDKRTMKQFCEISIKAVTVCVRLTNLTSQLLLPLSDVNRRPRANSQAARLMQHLISLLKVEMPSLLIRPRLAKTLPRDTPWMARGLKWRSVRSHCSA